MTNKKSTKRALLLSVLSLLLCVSMLIGSTFAWFTDSVTSGNNIIKSGNLDVQLFHSSKNVAEEEVTASTENMFKDVTLWEPGAMVWEKLTVKNNGSLALQYALNLNVLDATVVDGHSLTEVLKVAVMDAEPTRDSILNATMMDLASFVAKCNRPLDPGASESFYVAIYWAPTANDNDYNVAGEALNVTLGVNLVATQYTKETDSFNDQYDVLAQGGYASAPAPTAGWEEIPVYAGDSNVKAATMLIHSDAVEDPDLPIEIAIVPTDLNENVTVDADQEAATYEITVSNLKENYDGTPIKVELNVGIGKTNVVLYHHGTPIDSTYNPHTGYVIFETTSFSPYTVVFDAVTVEIPTEAPTEAPTETTEPGTEPGVPSDLPVANVTNSPEFENVDLPWGSAGGVAPTPGLDSYLEAAYTFTCADVEGASTSPYADWYCDFYVMLDKDLGANQIFLGGNYGGFGWIGFHNGDLTLEANTEIPLLGSVTQKPWTYQMVAENVGTFICGVGDVDDALADATFTVMLRLTNPENEAEYYNVSTINYTFTESALVSSADQLQAAVAEGGKVVLGADIDMDGARVDIPQNTNTIIDLNGYTLTSKDGGDGNWMAVKVNTGANLILEDSVGTGKIVASCYGVYVQHDATFTMNGGTIHVSGNGAYDMGVVVWNGKFVMNAGTIEGLYAVYASDYWKNQGTTDMNCEITIAAGCTLTGTHSQVNIAEAPTAVVNVPNSITVTNVAEE